MIILTLTFTDTHIQSGTAMNAYVAVTDADWYGFLSRPEDLDEVNFWQPKPWGRELGVLRRGEPLLFKLKAPHNAIAAVGFFERYVTLPFSLRPGPG